MDYDLSKGETLPTVMQDAAVSEKDLTESKTNKNEKLLAFNKNDKGYSSLVREKNGKKIEIEITPDENNLPTYVEYNKSLIEELKSKKNVRSTITFTKPVGLKELKAFGKKFGVEETIVYGRAIDEQGERVTVAAKMDVNDIDLGQLKDHLGTDAKFVGFYAIDGLVENGEQLNGMVSDKNVFLVDVVSNFVENNEVKTKLPVEVEVQSPYWYIEE